MLKRHPRIRDQFHLRPGDAVVSATLPFTCGLSLSHPLYQSRNTAALESHYNGRSADLAWQLLFASAAIIVRITDK